MQIVFDNLDELREFAEDLINHNGLAIDGLAKQAVQAGQARIANLEEQLAAARAGWRRAEAEITELRRREVQ